MSEPRLPAHLPARLPARLPAQVTAWAPGRVNLIGEHTDYNAGLCLPVTIAAGTTARATRRPDDQWHLSSAQQDQTWIGRAGDAAPGAVTGWAAYAAGVLWALTEAGHDISGMDVEIDGRLPLGAGLSSSASLEAAVAVAACGLAGIDVDPVRPALVEVCRRAESEVVGAPTGGLDQSAVLLVEPGAALLLDFADGSAIDVALPVVEDGLALLVIDTRVAHAHATGSYSERRSECRRAARALGVDSLRASDEEAVAALIDPVLRRRARHVLSENARVSAVVDALEARDWTTIGALFTASHVSMCDDFEISCAELDVVVTAALGAGAYGARMTGGGFGGSAIALVPVERASAVSQAVDTAFARAGWRTPRHFDGTPSGPARLIEATAH